MKRVNKKEIKQVAQKCCICGVEGYSTLDVHRILPGEKGGKYHEDNVTVLCSNCHRRVHSGEIVIDRWYHSTAGRLLRIIINGEEKFV
jgi:5-methylcytosine-specific restriction endonuclease McrA